MAVDYLHGVETVDVDTGSVTIRVVKSAVIALFGTAPKGAVNTLTLVNNPTDAAQFGKTIAGFTIPQALEAIFKKKAGTVLVVNVVDTSVNDNLASVTAETKVVANRKFKTSFAPFGTFVLTNSGATVTYTKDTDYKVDEEGNVTILAATGTIAEGASLKATYKKYDASTVTNDQLIGEIDGTTGVKTGTKLFQNAFNAYGFKPKVIISPYYSEVDAIAAEMIVMANYYRGRAYIDAPLGTTVANAILGRGPSDGINFYTSNKRAYLFFPRLKAFNTVLNDYELQPYSQFAAGVRAAVDIEKGYWYSISNNEIAGITGAEIPISFAINDATTEANQLNAAGITTYAAGFGTGYRVWGNRTAAFPSSSKPAETFESVLACKDIVDESIELAMIPYVDIPLSLAILDSVRDDVNTFLRTLIGRGALVDGELTIDPAKNPPEQLALGHAVFCNSFMPPPPLERMTFESHVDISLLKKLIIPS